MQPSEFYQQIIASIDEADERKVGDIMAGHIGYRNMITLQNLAIAAFGEFTPSTERKTREILETLTLKYGMAVCSLSGKAGRWLAETEQEREAAAKELEARGNHDLDRARALRRAMVPGRGMTDKPKQSRLWT